MQYDVIIVGGGIVGLTCALALAQQTTLTIAVTDQTPLDFTWSPGDYSHRVSAVTLASVDYFKQLGVWEMMQKMRVSPFEHIEVYDASHHAVLNFNSQEIAAAQLGYIIENKVMQAALLAKIRDYSAITLLSPLVFNQLAMQVHTACLHTQDEQVLSAALLIGADGARSWLRDQAGILLDKKDYEQQAIVATVTTALPHQKVARQVFLEDGPLAFLPLNEPHVCSIVWSVPMNKVHTLMALDDAQFRAELARVFANRLGEVIHCSGRFAYPLGRQAVKNYVKSRLALVGDAAHTMHPLAGQGANLGIADAMHLLAVITQAHKKQRDIGSIATLRRYERARKAENFPMLFGVDAIKKIFASERKSVQQLRYIGCNLLQQLPVVKKILMQHAVGKTKFF